MFGWTAAHIPLFAALPLLLAGSAFFSGSETALFGLTHPERQALRRRGGVAARAVEGLLATPRRLLITVLLGNMIVNVLFFVISSVLTMAATEASIAVRSGMAVVSLLAVILFGEVLPKLAASAGRERIALLIAPPLWTVHRLIAPVRGFLEAAVVAPLGRLTAPTAAPATLSPEEIEAMFEVSEREGTIDGEERRILGQVVDLGRRRVKQAMTPRVRLAALPLDASREDVRRLASRTRLTKIPVYERTLDQIVGILNVKRYLLDDKAPTLRSCSSIVPPRFVPELATLERMLDDFRATKTQFAVVVDEYGGTAGVVAIEDVVREIMGELHDPRAMTEGLIRPIEAGRWRVRGEVDIRDLAAVIPERLVPDEAASVSGLVVMELGRAPEPGEVVRVGALTIQVEETDATGVATAVVSVEPEPPATHPADGERTA